MSQSICRRSRLSLCCIGVFLGISLMIGHSAFAAAIVTNWVNHLALLPGDESVDISFNAVSSGVGGSLGGLVVTSITTGEEAIGGGNKVVWMALQSPPNFEIVGVRVCYESSNSRSFISQIRIAQVEDPPASALVILDDGTDLVDPGPVCVNSAPTSVKPSAGALLFSLRVNFGNIADKIVIRGLGLRLKKHGGF